MLPAIYGVVHNGKIEVPEGVKLPEGRDVLITLLTSAQNDFWRSASERSLAATWDNAEDAVYSQLLEE